MSMLGSDVHAQLAELLRALQSSDNNVRVQAEDHLQKNWTESQPHILLMGLAEQMAGSTEEAVCSSQILLYQTSPGIFLTMATTDSHVCCCHLPQDFIKAPQERQGGIIVYDVDL